VAQRSRGSFWRKREMRQKSNEKRKPIFTTPTVPIPDASLSLNSIIPLYPLNTLSLYLKLVAFLSFEMNGNSYIVRK